MHSQCENANEVTQHRRAIDSLAKETKNSVAIVKGIYDAEVARLEMGAHFRDYLVLLATRRTKDLLRIDA